MKLSSKAATYLDSLGVDAQMLLYTGSLASSPKFEKIDSTTYSAEMTVDEGASIDYKILFYKEKTIEIYGLDTNGEEISSTVVCDGLDTKIDINVDDFTKVAKLDLDIVVLNLSSII